MKLSAAEYKVLDHLDRIVGGSTFREWLNPQARRVASKMRFRGLISKRAWDKGRVSATALGKRSHAYGPR